MTPQTLSVLNSHQRASSSGFTLVEVLVVISILAILSAIAFPAFRSFTSSSQVTSAANDLVSALNLARSEAVTRGVSVTVCKSADQASCDDSLDWQDGWIVFVDINSDGAVDTDDIILRVYSAPRGVMMTGGPDHMTYAASGFFSADFSGTIAIVADGRQVDVVSSVSGRVHTDKP